MRFLTVILLFLSISGYSQLYEGEPTLLSRIKPEQIRWTGHPTANHIYVIQTDSATGHPYWGLISKNTGGSSGTQTFSNTSNSTSHTLSLSNSGGSFQLVEGSNITLSTTGTTSDGICTIAANFSGLVADSRLINTTLPLTGGGDLTGDLTLSTSLASGKLAGRATAGTGVIEAITLGVGLSFSGTTLNIADNSNTNEGLLSVGAGSSINALIISNTSGSPDITIEGAGNNAVTEVGNKILITGTDTYTGTVTSIGITAPAAGITVSGSPVTTSGSITLALANDLLALENLASTGYAVRTASNTWAQRTFGNGTKLTVTNGSGVSGNTSYDLNTTAVTPGTYGSSTQVAQVTLDAYGTVTAASNVSISLSGLGGVPTSRVINTTAPLIGGGALSADLTISTSLATNKLAGRATAGTGVIEAITLGDGLSYTSTTLNVASQTLSIFAGGGTIKLSNYNAASTFIQLKDSSLTNEGLITASLSSTNNAQFLSNTSGSTAVHIIAAGTNTLGVSGQNITITGADQFLGTVLDVTVSTNAGVSGVVTSPTTHPSIAIALGAITPSSVAASGTVTGSNLSGTNTGDQTITLTSDVTGSGTGSFATTIAAGAVTLAKMANLAANSIIGNNTGSPTTPIALTATQVKTLLSLNNVENTALSTWAGTTNLTTLGTITTGVWNGTDVAMANIAQVGANTVLTNPTTGTADISTTALSASNLLGRGSTGNIAAITVSGILSFSGTVLSATEIGTVSSVSGTTNRITVATGTSTPVIDISASYVGQSSITTLGTIGTGTWQGTSIATTYTDAKIKTVTGTLNRLTIGGTSTDPTFDVSTSYVGQATITTLGTITTGTWTGTDVAFANIAQLGANTVATNATTGTADISSTALSASNLLGRGSTGNIAAITVGGILSFSGTVLSATEVDGLTTNEGSLTVLAGSSSNSIFHSNTSGSADITVSVAGGMTIAESGNLITLTGGLGTIKWIKAGADFASEYGIAVAFNTNKDTAKISLDYNTMTSRDSIIDNRNDYVAFSQFYSDVWHNSKIKVFDLLKMRERTITTTGNVNWDNDDSHSVVFLDGVFATTYKLPASPNTGEEVTIISGTFSGHIIDGNGKTIEGSATKTLTNGEKYYLWYSGLKGKWYILMHI